MADARDDALAAVLFTRAAVDGVRDDDRSFDVVASTEAVDAHGTVLRSNWDLERFAANPVVLYSHNRFDLPIGLASDVRVEKQQLRARITLSTADLNPFAEQVWRNVQGKVLRGVSVGFRAHTVVREVHDDVEVFVLDDLELIELSITPVPSNPEALAQMRSLATRGAPRPTKETTMSLALIRSILKLSETADENACVRAITALEDRAVRAEARTSDLEAPTGKSGPEALGTIRAWQQSSARLIELEADIKRRDDAERDALITQAKLTPPDAERWRARPLSELRTFVDEMRERDALIVEATRTEGSKHAGKLTPKSAEYWRARSVAELRAFLDVAPRVIPERGAPQPAPAPGAGDAPTANGKRWEELAPMEKHRLWNEQPEIYEALKADHARRMSA